MEARSRVVVCATTLLALLAVAWLLFDRDALPAPRPTGDTPSLAPSPATPTALASADPAPPTSPEAGAAGLDQTEAAARSAVHLADPNLATLRGRCVDEHGAPLADCKVSLQGWECNNQRMEAWLTDHGKPPTWQNPAAVTTAADGVFVFTFWPPPPFQFALDVAREGRGAMNGRWSELAEGSTKDVGDVVMSPGVLVRGRVVDDQGIPQAKEYVTLQRRRPGGSASGIEARWGEQCVSNADGTFGMRASLAPGEYEIRTDKAELQTPKTVVLLAERREETLAIVVRTRPAAEAITGRVLDETGAPVAGIRIEDRSPHGWSGAHSGRDGTFKLENRNPDGAKKAALLAVSDQYEVEPQPREVAWGTHDVEFRVSRAASLTLRVTDEQGAPIDTYLVRLIPRNRGGWSSSDAEARAQGEHEDGTVVIPGLTRGDWLLMVEFPAGSGCGGLRMDITQESGPKRLDLRAPPLQRRGLRVLGADGPVAGSKVQLCDPFDRPFDDERLVMRRDHWLMNAGSRNALVLYEGTTDADGRLELLGPGDRELGLCVLGPGHIPVRQAGLRLDVAGELVLRVSRGAQLVGKVVPNEALAELQRMAGAEPGQGFPGNYWPTLSLADGHGGTFPKDFVSAQERKDLQIGDDGTFHVEGLPPGIWRVQVQCWIANDHGAGSHSFPADTVTLVADAKATLDLDLSSVLPGELQGSVHHNGQPVANGKFVLQGPQSGTTVTTDAEGRFAARTLPGDYQAVLNKNLDATHWTSIACPTPVHVTRGQTTSLALVFTSSTLRATVLDSKGAPAAGVTLYVQDSDRAGPSLPTDEQGVALFEVTTGTVSLRVLPKALSTPEGQQKLWAESSASGNRDPFAPHWLALSTVTLVAGETTAVELRLPESAGY